MSASAGASASVDFQTRLQTTLTKIQPPSLYDCAWIGPFEQLVGAAYSLVESEKRRFSNRGHSNDYHPAVQCKIVSLLEDFEAGRNISDKEALENWLSRYYFNCGIQRVNFAAERLVVTYAALHCSCGGHPPQIQIGTRLNFSQKLKGARTRVAHIETEYGGSLAKLKEVLTQLGTPYERTDVFDPSKALAMLRQDVNTRKHSAYRRSDTLDSLPTPSSGTVTWANAGFRRKMEVAAAALELVVAAYAESIAWFPEAKL